MSGKSPARPAKVQQSAPAPEIESDHFGIERLVFFSDAVFAIAITLLALEIRLPETSTHLDNDGLLRGLLDLTPKYLSFVISFLVIGLYWMTHHRRFRFIKRYDRTLLWLNLLLMMVIAFIPFPTSVLSEYGNRTATIFYALVITLCGLLSATVWLWASWDNRLLDPPLTREQNRAELLRTLLTPTVFLLSIGIAFVNDDLAKYSWGLLFLASVVDRQIIHPRR